MLLVTFKQDLSRNKVGGYIVQTNQNVKSEQKKLTNNIVTSSVRNNSKCIVIPPSRTDQYKHSFFVQTAVAWNHLDENTVPAEKLESFKSALADHRD